MQITGVTLDQFRQITGSVSAAQYSHNLSIASSAHTTSRGITARLSVANSTGPGSRLAGTGKPGPYACWHTYRDVLTELFARYRDAQVRTSMAIYRGANGFLSEYPETAVMDSGRPGRAVYMPDLCRCSHNGMPYKFVILSRPPGTFAPYLTSNQNPQPAGAQAEWLSEAVRAAELHARRYAGI
jgi:hypothetical protein